MSLVSQLIDIMWINSDPRTNRWFLVDRPGTVLIIIGVYLSFCKVLGPRIMRDREPYPLKNTLIVYNFFQILLSAYMLKEGLQAAWLYDYKFRCQPVDFTVNPKSMRVARAMYVYFISKLIELLDTVFFVFRKKQRQITFLHLYHHAIMIVCAWLGVRYVPGGHPTLLGTINAFVHIVMYFYYMLAAIGPQMQKYLWWKRYLTTLQLAQFTIIFVQDVHVLFSDCDYPKLFTILMLMNAGIFMYMFASFYIKNYVEYEQEPETLRLKTSSTDNYKKNN